MQNPDRIAKTLAGIKSRYGSFGVFGNHDVTERLLGGFSVASQAKEMRDPRFEEFVKKAKIRILDDEVMLIDDALYRNFRGWCLGTGDACRYRLRDLSDHDSFSGMSFEPCLYKSMNQETVQQNGRKKELVRDDS